MNGDKEKTLINEWRKGYVRYLKKKRKYIKDYIKDYIISREIMEKKLYSFTKETRFDDRDSYTDVIVNL